MDIQIQYVRRDTTMLRGLIKHYKMEEIDSKGRRKYMYIVFFIAPEHATLETIDMARQLNPSPMIYRNLFTPSPIPCIPRLGIQCLSLASFSNPTK